MAPISQQQHWKPGDEETMPSASSGGKCYFQTGFYIQPLSVSVRVEKRQFFHVNRLNHIDQPCTLS